MWFLWFLISLFILLILITISSTLIGFALKLVTKRSYEQHVLIVPSILSLAIWVVLCLVFIITLNNVFKINILDAFLNNILYFNSSRETSIGKIIGIASIFALVGVIAQSFTYLTLNIDYNNMIKSIKKKLKLKEKEEVEENIEQKALTVDIEKKLTYVNSLISSLFLFSIVFFFVLVFLALGNVVAGNILK